MKRLLRRLGLIRPAPAGPPRVVDMSTTIMELEPDTSMFTAMLTKIGRPPEIRLSADPRYHDDTDEWFWEEWSDLSPEAESALRAYSGQVIQPDGYLRPPPTFSWWENELFPRLAA